MNGMKKIRAGIIGGAGYTGGELLRLLLRHPATTIDFVNSRSNAGKAVHDVHTDLVGETDLEFSEKVGEEVDVLFLCLGHGEAKKWLTDNTVDVFTKVIDLSQDFRVNDNKFVYGLPELHKDKIAAADRVANPGCFATAIQLALLPLATKKLLKDSIHVSATTGSTGAGQSLSSTSHFTWRHGNHSAYKVLGHQHLAEIGNTVKNLQPEFSHDIHFVPCRGAFSRGIHAVTHTTTTLTKTEAEELYTSYYAAHPFVHRCKTSPDVKQAANTNKCLLHVDVIGDRLVVTTVIDNLLKGASGQAVQNMNLLFGLDEKTGLDLKPSAY